MLLRRLMILAGLTSALSAQGLVPPFQMAQSNRPLGLNAGAVPGIEVRHVDLVHLPGSPPNVFYGSLTVLLLPPAFGGVARMDLLCGTYDVSTDTFTPNMDAAALNTSASEWGMRVHRSGLLAVFDRLNGWPWLAARPALGQPWQVVGAIRPLVPQSGYDPVLADHRGRLHLVYRSQRDIVMSPIDPATGFVTGSSTVIVVPSTPSSFVYSPQPVTDANGELLGISHSERNEADGDHRMSMDLDPATPSVLMNDTTTWTHAGGFTGGRFFDGECFPLMCGILAVDAFWFTGGRAAIGTSMPVTFHAPPGPLMQYISTMLVALDFATPASVPGLHGQFGLQTSTMVWDGSLSLHGSPDGSVTRMLAVPNDPVLRGASLAAQAVTFELLTNRTILGNTAALIVD